MSLHGSIFAWFGISLGVSILGSWWVEMSVVLHWVSIGLLGEKVKPWVLNRQMMLSNLRVACMRYFRAMSMIGVCLAMSSPCLAVNVVWKWERVPARKWMCLSMGVHGFEFSKQWVRDCFVQGCRMCYEEFGTFAWACIGFECVKPCLCMKVCLGVFFWHA